MRMAPIYGLAWFASFLYLFVINADPVKTWAALVCSTIWFAADAIIQDRRRAA